jgi:hypothetical protein
VRASNPSLLAAGRAMALIGDSMVSQWADWIGKRIDTPRTIPRPLVERELHLIVSALNNMVGPFRREVKPVWARTCEHYGRVGAARGLAAGDVVEEFQHLRTLLTRNLAPVLITMRARRAMAIVLRLNMVLDQGIAYAVVGYTDALVATLFAQNGVPATEAELDASDIERQIDAIEIELGRVLKTDGPKE